MGGKKPEWKLAWLWYRTAKTTSVRSVIPSITFCSKNIIIVVMTVWPYTIAKTFCGYHSSHNTWCGHASFMHWNLQNVQGILTGGCRHACLGYRGRNFDCDGHGFIYSQLQTLECVRACIRCSCTVLTVHHLLTSLVHNWNWKPKHVYTCTQGFGAAFSGFNEIISLQIKATICAVH